MANDDSVTVSFRLNLNREEDWEIHRYLEDETAMFCFGDKSKFIKKALIRAIHGIKRDEENKHLVCEMNTQRTAAEKTVVSEADRIIDAVKLIIKDEMERFAGMQTVKEKQVVTELTESMPKASKEATPTFGVVPESLGEVFFVKHFSLKKALKFPVFIKGFSLLSAGIN